MDQTNRNVIQNQIKLEPNSVGCGCTGSAAGRAADGKSTPPWVIGSMTTTVGTVPTVATVWNGPDFWGQIKCRLSAFRMNYSVEPGLYAVGNPDNASEVLVSANYKLSFDMLRRALQGMNAWILVLDSKGINVWCAAGKGTFGTDELVKRIIKTRLSTLVDHKRIIVPQLGAPGIAADKVKKMTGFHVYYGPVRASDIPQYLSQNYQATSEMRAVRFSFLDRLILTPIELLPSLKGFALFVVVALLLFGLRPSGILFGDAWNNGLPILISGALAVVSGAFLTPVLLPYIPVRSFAIKGWIVGMAVVLLSSQLISILAISNIFLNIFYYLFFPVVSSYLALQFTGATPFTNVSGVKKELRIGIPIYISVVVVSIIVLIAYKVNEWGLV